MELMAVIQGLMAIKAVPSIVTITSDSKYVLEAGERGAYSRHAANPDLLAEMHRLARMHTTSWFWTEGHAGHDDNEQCDLLAHKAALTQTSSWDDNRPHEGLQPPAKPVQSESYSLFDVINSMP